MTTTNRQHTIDAMSEALKREEAGDLIHAVCWWYTTEDRANDHFYPEVARFAHAEAARLEAMIIVNMHGGGGAK